MALQRWITLAVAAVAVCARPHARAHTPSETFLTVAVTATNVTGYWDVAVSDLQQALPLSAERWAALPPEQQESWTDGFASDILHRLGLTADGRSLAIRLKDVEPVRLAAGDYKRLTWAAPLESPAIRLLEINGRALLGVDTNLHGRLRVEHVGRTQVAAFDASQPVWRCQLAEPASRGAQAWTFIREGVGHIWQGPDHILFLLALLLPAVFRRADGRWVCEPAFRPVAWRTLQIVTAFTLAHSVTLSLAVLDVMRISPRIVEPLIAASVIAAACNNLRPWYGQRGWMVAVAFGLVHGFGLAGGLLEFGLAGEALAVALAGYNLGVELGQLAIVAVFLPLAYLMAGSWAYRTVAFKFGSTGVVLVAGIWMAERLFDFKVLPF
ncbi:MAG: HupE/UreJ family protein [Verrucomicrobia bacterium]|nr:HupE/UreJ family protein [Verrucomicrobiota bacterium]